MKRFVLGYLAWMMILFWIFSVVASDMAQALNAVQTQLTLALIAPFLHTGQLQGINIWINPNYWIIITDACNGTIPILMLWAAILAYPADVLYKAAWLLLGYTLFSLVNAVRIVMVVYLVEYNDGGHASFHWVHDLLGNALLLLVGLGIFIVFVKTSAPKHT